MTMACYASGGDDGIDPAHLNATTAHAEERVNGRGDCDEQDTPEGALEAKHIVVGL
jgi:hypothetical protein